MGFLSDLFGGIEDSVKGIGRGIDDTVHDLAGGMDDFNRFDWSGVDDRARGAASNFDDTINQIPGGWLTALSMGAGAMGAPMLNFGSGIQNEVLKRAVNQGAYGGINAAAKGQNIAQGAGLGAIAGGVGGAMGQFNPSQHFGITNQALGDYVNRAIGNTAATAATGGDVAGSVGRGLIGAVPYGMDQLSQPASPSGGQSFAPQQPSLMQSVMGQPNTPQQSMDSYVSPERAAINELFNPSMSMPSVPVEQQRRPTEQLSMLDSGRDSGSSFGSNLSSMFNQGMEGLQSAFPNAGLGDASQGLMALYDYAQRNKAIKKQQSGLQNMFGPDSAYATTMRQGLERKDARFGRRSQYGPREVELQAKLAEMNSRNAPMIQSLSNQGMTNKSQLLNTGFQLLKGSGVFGNNQPNSFGPYLNRHFRYGEGGD